MGYEWDIASGNDCYIAIEHMAIEIVSFPIKIGEFLQLCRFTRGDLGKFFITTEPRNLHPGNHLCFFFLLIGNDSPSMAEVFRLVIYMIDSDR